MTKKKAKTAKRAKDPIYMQWKVLQGLHIDEVERTCEEWTSRGWTVFSILGPLGNVTIILNRLMTL